MIIEKQSGVIQEIKRDQRKGQIIFVKHKSVVKKENRVRQKDKSVFHDAKIAGFCNENNNSGTNCCAGGTPAMTGFYSDSYKGEEVYDLACETWELTGGSGEGNGWVSHLSESKVDLNQTTTYSNLITAFLPWDITGTYNSNFSHSDETKFGVTFTVDAGEWKSVIVGKDAQRTTQWYEFRNEGEQVVNGTPPGSYPPGSVLNHFYKDHKVSNQWTESAV